ncbi:MAG: electron transport complex subunit E [Lachnospiraceae bacterium]|nr:electron transport complex subunit E [Lachnospiraceae bacterium]
MSEIKDRLVGGLFKENPTFVLMLGMCPTLAVTTSAINGMGMGLTTMVVLALSNALISALRKVIPDRVRIPAFIVIIASFVTITQFLLEGFIPSLYEALGIYIPLIVVNCIILGRAESYASKNGVVASLFDGIGMGLGFTCALTIIGAVRELLGAGEIFGARVMPASYEPIRIFIMAPGAFFVLATLTAIMNKVKMTMEAKGKDASKIGSGCVDMDCANCAESDGCARKFIDTEAVPGESLEEGAKRRDAEANPKEKSEVKAEEKTENKADEKTEKEAEEKAEDKAEDKPEEENENNAEGKEDK